MAKVVVTNNFDKVASKLQAMSDVTKNLRPLMEKVLGEKSDSAEPWTMRGSFVYGIQNGVDVKGHTFEALTKNYKKQKDRDFSPDLPILMRSGALYDSLVNAGREAVEIYTDSSVTWGTTLPYAARLNYGFNAQRPRQFLGFREGQLDMINLQARAYLMQAYRSKGG